jgi:gamma-tubulin complex component 3
MSSSADIARLVASLIDASLPALDERRSAALLNFAMRILGSHMPAPPGGSQPMEVARRRLVREGRAADALALSEQLQRLQRSDHGLRRLEPLLQLLGALMLSPPPGAEAHGAAPSLLARAAAAPPLRLAPAPERVRAPEPQPAPARPFAYGTPPPVPPAARARANGGGGAADEAALVREVLFVMQNIDGVHLKWDDERDAFVLPPTLPVAPATRQLVGRLAELGWMCAARARATRRASRRAAPTPTLPPPYARAGIGSSTRTCTLRRRVRRRASCPRRSATASRPN